MPSGIHAVADMTFLCLREWYPFSETVFCRCRQSRFREKIHKGERRIKYWNLFQIFFIPNRILSYPKIVKGECRSKRENLFFKFDYAEPHPILSKDCERWAKNKISKLVSVFFIPNRILSPREKSGKNFFTFPSQCFRSKSFIYRFFYYFCM